MLATLFLITRNPEPERTGGGIGQEAGEQGRERDLSEGGKREQK